MVSFGGKNKFSLGRVGFEMLSMLLVIISQEFVRQVWEELLQNVGGRVNWCSLGEQFLIIYDSAVPHLVYTPKKTF